MSSTVFWRDADSWKCYRCSTNPASILGTPKTAMGTGSAQDLQIQLPFQPRSPNIIKTNINNKNNNRNLNQKKIKMNMKLINEDTSHPLNSKGIKIAHLNVNSLRNKLSEISLVLTMFQISILTLTESKLNKSDITTSLTVEGYNLCRFDNEFGKQYGGGILIYISQQYAYDYIDYNTLNPNIQFPFETEVQIIKFKPPYTREFVLVTIYKPPAVTQLKLFLDALEKMLTEIQKLGLEVIITGDMNIDLFEKSSASIQILNITRTYGLKQVISEATRVTNSSSKLLDHLYVPNITNYSVSGVYRNGGFSDHEMIYVIRKHVKIERIPPLTITTRFWNKVNFDQVTTEVQDVDWTFIASKTSTIDEKTNLFNKTLLKIVDKHAPLKKMKVRGSTNPWMNGEIIRLRRERDRAYRLLRKIKPDEEPNKYEIQHQLYKKLKNKTNNLIRQTEKNYFNSEFKRNAKSTTKTWNTMNQLTRFRWKEKHKFINVTDKSGNICGTNEEIAKALSEVFLLPDQKTDEATTPAPYIKQNEINYEVSTQTVFDAINSTKTTPVSAVEVPPIFIKGMSMLLSDPICQLFNESLKEGYYPSEWKTSYVTPLYKGRGSKTNPGNFRPIANTMFISKVYEKVLKGVIVNHINDHKLFSENQHGYRSGRSCSTALKILTNYVYENCDNPKGKVPVIFVDFSKAFDTVSHTLLIHKLKEEFRLNPIVVKIIEDYLKDRFVRIKINGELSNSFPVYRGVPQGSILGPLLFSLFINELDQVLLHHNVQFILYADDLAIYTYNSDLEISINSLNNVMHILEQWTADVGLQMNYSKTKYMIFHKNRDATTIKDHDIFCNNNKLEKVMEFKYLGIYLDPSLSFSKHLKMVEGRVTQAIGRVDRLKRKITESTFILLLNSYILSIIDYCLTVWAVQPDNTYNVMQKRINNLLYTYYMPTYAKRRHKRIYYNSKFNDIQLISKESDHELWELTNIHSITERIRYYTLTEVFKTINYNISIPKMRDWFTERMTTRSNRFEGLLELVNHNSEFYKSSFKYRAISLWNSMIKAKDVYDKKISNFKSNVALWVMKDRDNEYVN